MRTCNDVAFVNEVADFFARLTKKKECYAMKRLPGVLDYLTILAVVEEVCMRPEGADFARYQNGWNDRLIAERFHSTMPAITKRHVAFLRREMGLTLEKRKKERSAFIGAERS
jgi:hypothetical protein